MSNLDLNTSEIFGESIDKSTATVTCKADTECWLFMNGQKIATVKAGTPYSVTVPLGQHLFRFVSASCPSVCKEIVQVADTPGWNYLIVAGGMEKVVRRTERQSALKGRFSAMVKGISGKRLLAVLAGVALVCLLVFLPWGKLSRKSSEPEKIVKENVPSQKENALVNETELENVAEDMTKKVEDISNSVTDASNTDKDENLKDNDKKRKKKIKTIEIKRWNKIVGTYEGEAIGGMPHGYGKYTWTDGSTYEGGIKYGKGEGHGIFTWPNGWKYEGDVKGGKRTGRGVITSPDGNRYEGQVNDGSYNGQGVLTLSDGGRYEGYFKNNHYEGYGVYTWRNGDRYEGQWKEGKRHGHGTQYYRNGTKQEGEWKEGVFQGK